MMKSSFKGPLPWLGGLLAAYLAAPLVALAFAAGPHAITGLHEPGLWSATAISALAATLSAALIGLFGIPLGYLLARGRSRWLRFLEVLVQLPLAIPPLASGILLLLLVGPYTPIGQLTGGALTDSFAGIVIAQTFVAAPFMVIAARSAFAAVDPALDGVAATLGVRALPRFLRVDLPLAWQGIFAGALLAWVRAFGEFGATVMVAYHPYSLPVYTFVQFGSAGLVTALPPVVAALGAALLFLLASSFAAYRPRHRSPTPPDGLYAAPAAAAQEPLALSFDLFRRLESFELRVAYRGEGRRLVLVGPSGSGKSLTLRLLAGLEPPDAARVMLGGAALDPVSPEARQIGYVPQDYGLFPHLTVWQQATFGVGTDPSLAMHWLRRLGIGDLRDRLPAELSGGHRQRVALARALARAPRLLLLDEPFSALDAPERERLRRELRTVQREAGVTTVVVTHDPQDARMLADEILVLSQGRILQEGAASAVLRQPATAAAAALLGVANVFSGLIATEGHVALGAFLLKANTAGRSPGTQVVCHIPPAAVRMVDSGGVEAFLVDAYETDGGIRCDLRIGDLELAAQPDAAPPAGSYCRIAIPPESVRLWQAV